MKPSINYHQLTLAALLGVVTLHASATMVIRPMPADEHQHDRSAAKMFMLNGYENSSIQLWTPDLQTQEIISDKGHISLKPTGRDSYHLLIAQRGNNGTHETAIRYIPLRGKPSGHSPSELTAFDKTRLDIVPDPLPREHWHYKAGDTIQFIVRFDGRALASNPVSLSTSHGSLLRTTTDEKGRAIFTLRDDFPETRPGRSNNESAELLVHTKHSDNENNYATWLSADYQVNPAHWRDTGLGVMVASGGFIFGAFVSGLGFRARKNTKRKK